MKTASALVLAILSVAAASQALADAPAYSTRVDNSVNCFMNKPQFTLTPQGESWVVRTRDDNAYVLLSPDGSRRVRAELYRASDNDGRRLKQALRQCELTLPSIPPVMRNPQRLKP